MYKIKNIFFHNLDTWSRDEQKKFLLTVFLILLKKYDSDVIGHRLKRCASSIRSQRACPGANRPSRLPAKRVFPGKCGAVITAPTALCCLVPICLRIGKFITSEAFFDRNPGPTAPHLPCQSRQLGPPQNKKKICSLRNSLTPPAHFQKVEINEKTFTPLNLRPSFST
jgi:hypothetical protein